MSAPPALHPLALTSTFTPSARRFERLSICMYNSACSFVAQQHPDATCELAHLCVARDPYGAHVNETNLASDPQFEADPYWFGIARPCPEVCRRQWAFVLFSCSATWMSCFISSDKAFNSPSGESHVPKICQTVGHFQNGCRGLWQPVISCSTNY